MRQEAGETLCVCMQINLQKLWVTLGSIMVSLTFVFGNNMRSIYEAVVYLFVVHPYDVGDAVLCGPSQDWCTVTLSCLSLRLCPGLDYENEVNDTVSQDIIMRLPCPRMHSTCPALQPFVLVITWNQL